MSIEVIDRRGQNKQPEPVAPAKVVEMPARKKGADEQWKDVCYILAIMPQQNGSVIILGRAVGKRMDGMAFIADYMLPMEWKPDWMWQPKAKERLDTFLDCECATRNPCSKHKSYFAQWQQQDIQRMTLAQDGPVPEALEALILAEKVAQQSQILTPR